MMMLYAVIPLGMNERLRERIQEVSQTVYDDTYPHVYFLAYHGTATDLSSELGLGDSDGSGEGVVLRVGHHAGYTFRSLWEWLEKNGA